MPGRVNLGGGYVIRVVLLPPIALAQKYSEYVDTELDVESTFAGYLDDETWTMYINSRLPKAKKWETYWHELLHAVVDIKDLNGEGR